MSCGCIRSATEYCARGLAKFPENKRLRSINDQINDIKLETACLEGLPDRNLVRREVYAWNSYEKDRYSDAYLNNINTLMSTVAPKLVVKVTELPDLHSETNT